MYEKLCGIHEIQEQLDILEYRLYEADTRGAFADLFPRDFMQQYTAFCSMKQFFTTGNFDIHTIKEITSVSMEELDDFVAASTSFECWRDMFCVAAMQLILRNIQAH